MPVAKERGDRGRGTSAFEMVLSPGAGRASAAGGSSPLRHRSGRDSQCRRGLAAPPGTTVAGTASAAGGSLPLRAPQWQGEQVPPGTRCPSGHHSGRDSQCRRWLVAPPGTTVAGRASAAGGSPPLRAPQWQGVQVPPGASYPPPPSKIFLPPPIFIFCSPIYGILKQEKPEGV